eukprot:4805542-Ditylum_brightwellii.AAC.1
MEEDAVEDSELEETTEESEVESMVEEEDAAANATRNGKADKKDDLQSTDTEETPYNKQKRSPSMNNISVQEWRNLSAARIFSKCMPDGEIDLWSRLTTKKLIAAGKAPTSHEEMS